MTIVRRKERKEIIYETAPIDGRRAERLHHMGMYVEERRIWGKRLLYLQE